MKKEQQNECKQCGKIEIKNCSKRRCKSDSKLDTKKQFNEHLAK